MAEKHRVVILGGGFGGIAAALELERYTSGVDITLISDTTHFEYHAALYRVVAGRSPLEVCIPLSDIFEGKKITLIHDRITDFRPKQKTVVGEVSQYTYDSLIIALGSQSEYYHIPGLEEHGFTLKSINDALRLKRHLHEIFTSANKIRTEPIHIVIAGGGSSGVEIAGELALYCQKLAEHHNVNKERVVIDLFESENRLLKNSSLWASSQAFKRLHRLGVHISLNTPITKEDISTVYLPTLKLKTKTLIWTAGARGNALLQKLPGATVSDKCEVIVNKQLIAKGLQDVFVIGDSACTQYSGTAQTALYDAQFVTKVLIAQLTKKPLPNYQPRPPILAVPIGRGWALVDGANLHLTGKTGWIARRFADFKVFAYFLPLSKALVAFEDGRRLTESCPICSRENA